MNKRNAYIIWTLIGAITIAILASAIDIGDVSDTCNAGEYIWVSNESKWQCILNITAEYMNTTQLNATSICLNNTCISDWNETNISISSNYLSVNNTIYTNLTDLNTRNINISDKLNISEVCLEGTCIDKWTDVNSTGDALRLNQNNWFNDTNNWILWNTSHMQFNESKLDTKYYGASTSTVTRGTVQGVWNNTNHTNGAYDSLSYNFTEETGAIPINFTLNFTNVTGINQIIIRYKTTSIKGENPQVYLYNFDDDLWESYYEIIEIQNFETIAKQVYDESEHIQNQVVMLRIIKEEAGNTQNKYEFDWIAIADGYGTPSGEEVDPISIHKDGHVKLTGDWTTGDYTIYGYNVNSTNEINGSTARLNKIHTTQPITTTNAYGLHYWLSDVAGRVNTEFATIEDDLGIYGNQNISLGFDSVQSTLRLDVLGTTVWNVTTTGDVEVANYAKIRGGIMVIGDNQDVAPGIIFEGDTNNGLISWDEDDDRFSFIDDIESTGIINTSNKFITSDRYELSVATNYINDDGTNVNIYTEGNINAMTEQLIIGDNADDVWINFDGGTNDGVLKYMEDEDYFDFTDHILATGDINATREVCNGDGTCIGELNINNSAQLSIEYINATYVNASAWVNATELVTAEKVLTRGDKIIFEATQGTNNENLVLDLDTSTNAVTISTTSNAFIYWDNAFRMNDGKLINIGNSATDAGIGWYSYGGKSDGLILFTGVGNTAYNGYIRIMERADTSSVARQINAGDVASDPTVRIYSNDNTNANDYLDLFHDQKTGVIKSGTDIEIRPSNAINITGDINISNDMYVVGSTTLLDDVNIGKNITISGRTILGVDNTALGGKLFINPANDVNPNGNFQYGIYILNTVNNGNIGTKDGNINNIFSYNEINDIQDATVSIYENYNQLDIKSTAYTGVAYQNYNYMKNSGKQLNANGQNYNIYVEDNDVQKVAGTSSITNYYFADYHKKASGTDNYNMYIKGDGLVNYNIYEETTGNGTNFFNTSTTFGNSINVTGETYMMNRVGIDNLDPQYELHVGDGTDQGSEYIAVESDGGRVAGYRFAEDGVSKWAFFKHNGANSPGDIFLLEDGDDKYVMSFDNDTGYVGINTGYTTMPTQQLEVNGNINITGDVNYGGDLNSYSPLMLGKDHDRGYTTQCWWDKNGYMNLIYYEDGIQQIEKNSTYCKEQDEKKEAFQQALQNKTKIYVKTDYNELTGKTEPMYRPVTYGDVKLVNDKWTVNTNEAELQ